MAHQGVNQRRKLEEMNLEQVADEMALGPTSYNHHAAQAEFACRQAVGQRDAAKATQVKSLAGSSRSSAGVRLKWAPAEADARCISWDGEVTPGLRSGQKR